MDQKNCWPKWVHHNVLIYKSVPWLRNAICPHLVELEGIQEIKFHFQSPFLRDNKQIFQSQRNNKPRIPVWAVGSITQTALAIHSQFVPTRRFPFQHLWIANKTLRNRAEQTYLVPCWKCHYFLCYCTSFSALKTWDKILPVLQAGN